MSEANILVTVIIPCRNESAHIRKCIESIFKSDFPQANFEVLVAEGRSTDHTHIEIERLKKDFPSLKVYDNEKQITPAAFNIGMEKGHGQYLITIGSRHFISRNYLATCVSILTNNSEVACVGGKSICIENSETGEIIAKAMASPFGVGYTNFRSIDESAYVDTVGTPMYRKSVLQKVGGFDETLVRNQDDELSYRIAKAGFKIYQSNDIKVEYVARDSYPNLYRQLFQYGYWKVYVNKKHQTITTKRQLIPPMFVLYLGALFVITWFCFYAKWIYYLPLAAYLILAMNESYKASKTTSAFLQMIFCFFIMHMAYGFGYMQGIIHFMILNLKPTNKNKELSR